ncbi:glycosyltransferase [Oerskovia sp. M15]
MSSTSPGSWRSGDTVEVWTVDQGERLGTRVLDGVTVRYLPCPQPSRGAGGLLTFASRWPAAAWRWLRAYRSLRPEVLHVQCFGPNGVYAAALQRLTGTPLVVSSHGETFADDHDVFATSWWMRTWLKESLGRADAVTGCSTIVTEDLAESFGLPDAVVVPNGVDLDVPVPGPAGGASRPVSADVPRCSSRSAGSSTSRVRPPARGLRHDGSQGPYAADDRRGRLRARRAGTTRPRARRQDRVLFPGMLERQRSPPRWRALRSWSCRAAGGRLDRRARGLARRTTRRRDRAGRPRTLITDGVDGLLVDPRDPAALADAVGGLLDHPESAAAMGAAGRREVSRYTWEAVVERYDRIYERVLATGGRRRSARRHPSGADRAAPAPSPEGRAAPGCSRARGR